MLRTLGLHLYAIWNITCPNNYKLEWVCLWECEKLSKSDEAEKPWKEIFQKSISWGPIHVSILYLQCLSCCFFFFWGGVPSSLGYDLIWVCLYRARFSKRYFELRYSLCWNPGKTSLKIPIVLWCICTRVFAQMGAGDLSPTSPAHTLFYQGYNVSLT